MPRERQSKYFWPASAITESDMALLYRAREASTRRTTTTRLLALAVRESYGQMANKEQRREAA
jgi:hypothetical protein